MSDAHAGTKVAVFDAKSYDRRFLERANSGFEHHLTFFEAQLDQSTVQLAAGFLAICVFVNDRLDEAVLTQLAAHGTRIVALRCAGYNNVDLAAAAKLGITVVRVPAYSPHAVAEFTVGLLLALDRHIHRAWARVRENNFALDGLIGRNLFGRTVGLIGTGRIGTLVARIFKSGFGCDVLACDLAPNADLVATGIRYVERSELVAQADIISLHCPLTPDTRHIIDAAAIAAAKPGVIIINTSRGALIETQALIDGLKSHKIGSVALDVYEQEADLFFKDLSNEIIDDDVFQRLLTFPNVLVTGHQAFLTEEALTAIAETSLQSIADAIAGRQLTFQIGDGIVAAKREL
jgi:D-lactate dehydrogenase